MYTVVFVDGQPPANKDEIYEGYCRLFLSLSSIITREMLTIKKNLIKILINTGNQ